MVYTSYYLTEIKPLWGSSFRRPLGWTLSNPFSFANLFLVEKRQSGKKEGEREVQQACCCCMSERICTTVTAAQFGVYAVYVCATQKQFIDDA